MRIGLGATLVAAWVGAAALLWQTSTPALDVPGLDAASLFDAATLRRNARYENGLAALWAAGLVLQLGALWVLIRLKPQPPGPPLVQAALLGALVYATLWVAALPTRLGGHWWRRRYDVSELGYLRYLTGPWSTTLGELVLAALAGVAIVAAGRLLGRRAWLGLWAAFVALAAAYVSSIPACWPRGCDRSRIGRSQPRSSGSALESASTRSRSRCARRASELVPSTRRRSAPARRRG